jgi:hypothetical protein
MCDVNKIILKVREEGITDAFEAELREYLKGDYKTETFDNIQALIRNYCQEKDNIVGNMLYTKLMNIIYSELIREIMRIKYYVESVDHIFFIYTYIGHTLTYDYIVYIYDHLNDEDRGILNTRFLIFIYINMLRYTNEYYHDVIDMKAFKKHYQENIDLVKKMYDNKYITNPLYSRNEDIVREEYVIISLFDYFVHGTYILEYDYLGYFVMDIMIHNESKYTQDEWNGLFLNYVNIDSLYMLDTYTKNVGKMCIESMYDLFDENDFYEYRFLYYFNSFYTTLMNDMDKNSEYLSFLDETVISKWIDKKLKMIHISNTFRFDDLIQFVKHMIRMNNNQLLQYMFRSFEGNNLSKIVHIYIVSIILRMIYYRLPKFKNMMVKYNKIENYYFVDYLKDTTLHVLKFSVENYVKDVKEFFSVSIPELSEYVMKYVKYFLDRLYPELKSIEDNKSENRQNKTNECSICMENVASGDIAICCGCNNIFHKKCQRELFESEHQFCPLCRRCIYSTMLINMDVRYQLFTKLI